MGGRAGAGSLGAAAGLASVLGAAAEAGAGSSVLGSHELLSGGWDGWKVGARERCDVPCRAVGWALRGRAVGLGTTGSLWVGSLLEFPHEILEVLLLGDTIAVELNETEVGTLLRILVHQTTGEDGGHLGAIESLDLVEWTRARNSVATILGEKEGNGVVVELLLLGGPARAGVRAVTAPFVVVEGEEVTTLLITTAVEVVGRLVTICLDVSGRVPNGDWAVVMSLDVGPHVTLDSLGIRSSRGGGIAVDDLVSGEEEQGVVVLLEHVDGGKDALKVDIVVGRLGGVSVDRVIARVDVKSEVDTGVGKLAHTLVVVLGVVDSVDTDGVDAKLLELLDVSDTV